MSVMRYDHTDQEIHLITSFSRRLSTSILNFCMKEGFEISEMAMKKNDPFIMSDIKIRPPFEVV
jgi:hypothetical protein